MKTRAKTTRRRNPISSIVAMPIDSDPCQQCRLASRCLRVSITLDEAKRLIVALSNNASNSDLQQYFQAHLTIASRPDSYQYDC